MLRRRVAWLQARPLFARTARSALLFVGLMCGLGFVLAFVLAYQLPLPERLQTPASRVLSFRDGSPAHVSLAPDQRWRIKVALSEVDPAYLQALVRLEDKRFWSHPGVDPLAVLRATIQNLAGLRVRSGASTLTLQLVRVLEPRPRTLTSKLVEALRAFQLELRLSKPEILEAYLQYIPFGRNVEGVEAASLAYFGHRASALTAAEICTLLAVPQQPNLRYPTDEHSARLKAARDALAARLMDAGGLLRADGMTSPEQLLAQVRATPVVEGLRPFPRQAPHVAQFLSRRSPANKVHKSTLDAGTQRVVERTLKASRALLTVQNVHNACVLVIDHRVGEVLAAVGSFDFWSQDHGGQIVSFDVPRSVGSTLKPFLYASAIDRGLALPGFLVADVPVRYGNYTPQNFEGHFEGLVRLESALSRSLNLPFVDLLEGLGVESFVGLLRSGGATHLLDQEGYYGLSAAVGGIALTPLEVAQLYVALAENGRTRPLRWLVEEGAASPPQALFSEGAAWLTRRALSLRDRPDFPARRRISGLPREVHWKTGTSFGYRDAWAVGSNRTLTVLVWLGNLNYESSVALVGAEAAAPILFDLFDALGSGPVLPTEPPPGELVEIEVCSLSGHPPGPACPETTRSIARSASVPTQVCPYHVRRLVDAETGLALTPACATHRPHREESFTVYPPRVRQFLSGGGWALRSPPAWDPTCSSGNERPRILSPPSSQLVLLIRGIPADKQEVAFEAEASGGEHLSWFVDGNYLGTVSADQRLWWTPVEGAHTVTVSNAAGESDSVGIEVKGEWR